MSEMHYVFLKFESCYSLARCAALRVSVRLILLLYAFVLVSLATTYTDCFPFPQDTISPLEEHLNNASQTIWNSKFNATWFRERARKMFTFAYDNYMSVAFPQDELDPIHCTGRSADPNPANLNINDVLGNYSLTLIDALSTLAVQGNYTEFWKAANLAIRSISFDQNTNVQVFEATIRMLGGLLSAHTLATHNGFQLFNPDYENELLLMARDLATRLLPAFDRTRTGLPYPRVNLRNGVPTESVWRNDTNTAAVGTLLLEFGTLRSDVSNCVAS